ncbi:glycosyltransferase family 2 protein [Polaribacter sargassicola]|uniref:glycosyltransferase family 2 protein n=1 Tax=Polaribacter sargassicola TaxID=2836891 RepID=UPI001F1E6DB0|nr:glycosyltransferase family 2 protein [Polaribacter sp. DS7-9]MCG1036360.1 glycosyltransferase family 2 protein [Polaribacter sp. DS7-9]
MIKITAIIPTLNEEFHIEEAIESVLFADEIIVIDSFSTDNTVALAEKYNVKIIKRKFDDFSSQKNFAISKATNSWIYVLDADERVSKELREEILKAVKNPKDFVGFSFNRDFYFMNKQIKFGGYSNNKVIRLFDKNFSRYNGSLVHEKIITDGKIGEIETPIKHYSYKNFSHHLTKVQNYKELQAKELFAQGKKSSLFKIIVKPKTRFLTHYFFKLGFLDGFRGFVIAAIQSYGIFIKYVSLRLLQKKMK